MSGDRLAPGSDGVAARLVERNEALRTKFLREHAALSAAEVGPRAQDWLAAGEVFAVADHSGQRVFPAFQFDAARRPKPAVAAITRLFRERGASDWSLALWLNGPDPWLRGVPLDRLDREPAEVLRAAQRALNPLW